MSFLTAITGISAPSMRFVNYLNTSNTAKNLANSIALGRVICASLPHAEQDVTEDAGMHYRNTHHFKVCTIVDAVNELCPHDIKSIHSMVEGFYIVRTNAMYMRPTTYGVPGSENFLYNFFNLTSGFSKETLDFISKHNTDLTNLCSNYATLISDMAKPE